jgi:hypothetical protein
MPPHPTRGPYLDPSSNKLTQWVAFVHTLSVPLPVMGSTGMWEQVGCMTQPAQSLAAVWVSDWHLILGADSCFPPRTLTCTARLSGARRLLGHL